jgi:pyruvate,water dikinase
MLRAANPKYIFPLTSNRFPNSAGSKAENLRCIVDRGYLVPQSFICTWEAYLAHFQNEAAVRDKVGEELAYYLDPHGRYAVRSSANVEDSLEHSFAGQFDTILDVDGLDNVLRSIQTIWKSVESNKIRSYLKRIGQDQQQIKMAVLIQEMVKPVYSGVAFSRNPITAFDEIVVEAVQGSGTALVQDGLTPQRWVNKWGGWIEKPEDSDISLDFIEEVVKQTKSISQALRRDVDLEWLYDGQKLFWLQVRDITTSGEPDIYSNKIARETTPGMVQPLVWSVTVPLPSRAWVTLLTEIIGENQIDPNSLMRALHYRAYHNMGVFGRIFESLGLPRESLEMMMGVVPPGAGRPPIRPSLKIALLLPRIMRFVWDKWTFAKKLKAHYPRLYLESRQFPLNPSPNLGKKQLIEIVDQITPLNEETAYYTIVTILLMQIYNGLLKVRLRAAGVDFQEFDLTEGMEELKKYDPNVRIESLHRQYMQLSHAERAQIQAGGYETFKQMSIPYDFRSEMDSFFEQFGHLSDSTGHFGNVPWRESPDLILELIAGYEATEEVTSKKVRLQDVSIKGVRGRIFRLLYRRARQFRLYREMYSSLYSYTLMLFRTYYLALGEKLAGQGLIQAREDILYLYDDELRAFVVGERDGKDFSRLVIQRKDEMERCKDAIMPEVIFGNAVPPIITSYTDKLTGISTSRGYYAGTAKVVLGVKDFHKLEAGDVLVIPYSDVSWAPLFAKAGAVIAEAGGILSHSSIVAREYGLPAVVSVGGATLLLRDGMQVAVDGYTGEVTIHSGDDFMMKKGANS